MGVDIDWKYEHCTFHCVIPEDGIDVLMPCGLDNFIAEMERQVPGCKESVTNFFALAQKACAGFYYMTENAPAPYVEGAPGWEKAKKKHDKAIQ